MFQFLDRNSFGSDVINLYARVHDLSVSIPRSEFFRFGHDGLLLLGPYCPIVSIPRSEFFRFGRRVTGWRSLRKACFNSSIGILSVRTWPHRLFTPPAVKFQFLDRNSFGSDSITATSSVLIDRFQFLDRNSFGSDFSAVTRHGHAGRGFNSSIGILSVRTKSPARHRPT